MNRVLWVIAFILVVGIILWVNFYENGSSDQITVPTDSPSSEIQSTIPRRNSAKSDHQSAQGFQTLVKVEALDQVSSSEMIDCLIAIPELQIKQETTAEKRDQSYDIDRRQLAVFREKVAGSSDFSQYFRVHLSGSEEAIRVTAVEFLGKSPGHTLIIRITIARYAKVLVNVSSSIEYHEGWRCEISLCPPVPSGIPKRVKDSFELMRRIPRGYRKHSRKALGANNVYKSIECESLDLAASFLIERAGDYHVESSFANELRGVGQLISVTLGGLTNVHLSANRAPRVAGILLDTNGDPVPNSKLLLDGEGPLGDDVLLVPHAKESFGVTSDLIDTVPRFSVARYVKTNSNGEFSTSLTITNWVKIEAYIKGKGKIAREFKVNDSDSDLTGIVIRLEKNERPSGIVKLENNAGGPLRGEKVKIIRLDKKVGLYSPVVVVNEDGWLNTQWLESGGRYRGIFRSKKFKDFDFVCRKGERVTIYEK